MFYFLSGFLITFISKPVISGFTSAAAITIACSQLKSLFGLHYSSEGFLETMEQFFKNIKYTKWEDITLGICCVVCLLLLRVCYSFKLMLTTIISTTSTKSTKYYSCLCFAYMLP